MTTVLRKRGKAVVDVTNRQTLPHTTEVDKLKLVK